MTLEECERSLASIRRHQKTDRPVIRVDVGGKVYQGRLERADCDARSRNRAEGSPYGVLVLQPAGLGRGPETCLQIGSIPVEGLCGVG